MVSWCKSDVTSVIPPLMSSFQTPGPAVTKPQVIRVLQFKNFGNGEAWPWCCILTRVFIAIQYNIDQSFYSMSTPKFSHYPLYQTWNWSHINLLIVKSFINKILYRSIKKYQYMSVLSHLKNSLDPLNRHIAF